VRRTIVLSVLALLALTGCSTEVRGSASPADVVAPPTGDGTTEDDGSDDGTPDDGTDDGTEDAGSGTAAFGDTLSYDNGLEVTVSAPQPYTPSESAYIDGPTPAAFVAFDVTVVNGTGEDYDPIELFLTLQSGTTEEAQVFDTANGLDGTPYQTLLAGRSVAFTVGFGATDPADLVMEVTPGFDYEPVVYTS
jgi:hypothetical protein